MAEQRNRWSLIFLVVLLMAAAVWADEKGSPVLQSRLKLELKEQEVSLKDGKLKLSMVFFNETEKEQTFKNLEYQFAVLNKKGEQVKDALVYTTELRDIVLKGSSTEDKPGVMLNGQKLQPDEEYYLVGSVRNLVGLATFRTKK